MMDWRSVTIPLAANEKFRKHDGEKKVNSSHYRSLIGSLLYLTSTRPNIMFAASLLSRFMQEPNQVHWSLKTCSTLLARNNELWDNVQIWWKFELNWLF